MKDQTAFWEFHLHAFIERIKKWKCPYKKGQHSIAFMASGTTGEHLPRKGYGLSSNKSPVPTCGDLPVVWSATSMVIKGKSLSLTDSDSTQPQRPPLTTVHFTHLGRCFLLNPYFFNYYYFFKKHDSVFSIIQ